MSGTLTTHLLSPWQDSLSERARNLLNFLLSHKELERAVGGDLVLDFKARGTDDAVSPLLPQAVPIEVDPAQPASALNVVAGIRGMQDCIILRNVLQFFDDYRRFIEACFNKLRVDGCLIVVVPHQFLYERKLQVPSRTESRHLRFYTPGALLAEIEEALDPCGYRVRFLADNDTEYDYHADLESRPKGGYEIVICLQKIAGPTWRDKLQAIDLPTFEPSRPTRYLVIDQQKPAPYHVVVPDDVKIERIIVLKLDHRGDFLMAEDAMRGLRASFPSTFMTLACGSWNVNEAKAQGLFDEVLSFDYFPEDASSGRPVPSTADLQQQLSKLLQGRKFDLAIDLRVYEDTRDLLRLIDARHKAGFDPHDAYPWLGIRMKTSGPTREGRAESQVFLADRFSTRLGNHRTHEIVFDGLKLARKGRHLIWGPYEHLAPGHYEIEVLMEALGLNVRVFYDVVSNRGSQTLSAGTLLVRKGRYPRVSFSVADGQDGFELRVSAYGTGLLPRFRFMGIRVIRQGIFVGAHQSEAMSLLVHLTALRLRNPYSVEVK
jgi:hypothetical protein